jgi:hypothetical protein
MTDTLFYRSTDFYGHEKILMQTLDSIVMSNVTEVSYFHYL